MEQYRDMKNQEQKYQARFMLTAGASGSGKTLITCGILQALKARGLNTVAFKCGPDYIDPMFHSTVLGTKSRNLDTFFTDSETTRYLFARNAEGADISVIEGVMGYYDGLGGTNVEASAYDVARVTDTPVILIVNCKGMSRSVLPFIAGFARYREDSHIQGVILNRMSPMVYSGVKKLIEEELGIRVFGYVPENKELRLESRHLGLVMPGEIDELRERLAVFAEKLEETLDIDGILEMAGTAPVISGTCPSYRKLHISTETDSSLNSSEEVFRRPPVIAVAKDEAFCFMYEDNLQLLRDMGAKLKFFSPLHDEKMPEADGVLLYGGYPELYAKELSENINMRAQIRDAIWQGLPCLAECGGFMYLLESMEDMENKTWPMVGALSGNAYRTPKLGRFGYITLTMNAAEQGNGIDFPGMKLENSIRAHEFHYFDSTDCGDAFHAAKPVGKRSWDCIRLVKNTMAGYPHLYYYSNPECAERFLQLCAEYGCKGMTKK